MANYSAYIPATGSTTYPSQISAFITVSEAIDTEVEAARNGQATLSDGIALKLSLTGGTLSGGLTISTGGLTLTAGTLSLGAGNIDVTGNIAVSGTVDGRDISVDGAKLDDISYPASTTISTFGASLIDDTDAAAARTTLGISAFKGCAVYMTANQAVSNLTIAVINWTAEHYDTDNIHDNITNNDRLTIPTGATRVRLTFDGFFDSSNSTGLRQFSMTKNGLSSQPLMPVHIENYPVTSSYTRVNMVSPVISVSGTDYFGIEVYQDSGVSQNLSGTNIGCFFALEVIE